MKILCCAPLILLAACSSTPASKVDLRPQPALPSADNSAVRYPEIVHAYHFGRYIDPNDGLVMHEQHVVYRVEEISRWDLHPAALDGNAFSSSQPRDAAFSAAPVNDAILAEVNSQRLATAQIMAQGKALAATLQRLEKTLQDTRSNQQVTASLQFAVESLKKRLATLETAQAQTPANTQTTNAPIDINP